MCCWWVADEDALDCCWKFTGTTNDDEDPLEDEIDEDRLEEEDDEVEFLSIAENSLGVVDDDEDPLEDEDEIDEDQLEDEVDEVEFLSIWRLVKTSLKVT